jgi:serine/threonine-protein kinase
MDVIASHIKEDPRPVSTATLTPIPEGLERVIMQCLEKDPSNRPSSARAILQALESIEVAQPWTQQEAREWWSTHIAQVRVPGDAASTFSLPAQ